MKPRITIAVIRYNGTGDRRREFISAVPVGNRRANEALFGSPLQVTREQVTALTERGFIVEVRND